MNTLNNIQRCYFIGIGGIGMSAMARFFKSQGLVIAGYDRVSTPLTDQLTREGMDIHYTDDVGLIPEEFKLREGSVIIYTPAVPAEHQELSFFRQGGYQVLKRSEMLGYITNDKKGIAVAGTHGKTTISSMISWLLDSSGLSCNAFLGGISKNYDSNFVLSPESSLVVVEADEFDRSFLQLHPHIAVLTSIDPDHLDVYGDEDSLKRSFESFVAQINNNGILVCKSGLDLQIPENVRLYRYSLKDKTDFYATGIRRKGFRYSFNLKTPFGELKELELGTYGRINLENAVAALAVALLLGANEDELRIALAGYTGVKRRFDVRLEMENIVYIDDYAHHPEELKAFISSVREALPGKRISGIFQPHLFSRTRDFAGEFARNLSLLDDVIMLDIYPARELPIEGVTSKIIFDRLTNSGENILCNKEQLLRVISGLQPEVLLTMGAGDIDQLVVSVEEFLKKQQW